MSLSWRRPSCRGAQFRRSLVVLMSAVSRLVLATAATALASGAMAQEACKLPGLGTATVAGVRDGRTLLLTDGRELRLAAIEANDTSGAALNTLAAGRMLRLEKLGPEQDRYGRVVAIAYTDDARESVQQVMLAQGQARVSARVGDRPCAELLLQAERAARAAVRGLWADPNFAPLPSHDVTRYYGCSGSVRPGRGQGLVGARERRHNICQFRAAVDAGLHGHHPQASSARFRSGEHRSEGTGRPPDQGARLGGAAPCADHGSVRS